MKEGAKKGKRSLLTGDLQYKSNPEKTINKSWWKNLTVVGQRYPIEFYPEKISTFKSEYSLEYMHDSIQAWIQEKPWCKYPEHWSQVERLAIEAHEAELKVGCGFGFHVDPSFPKLYSDLPKEQKWCYPNGTVASDPFSVGCARSFNGTLSARDNSYMIMSHHNPSWRRFLLDWAKKCIDAGVNGIRIDSPGGTFPFFWKGGFGGSNTWTGFKLIKHLNATFTTNELKRMNVSNVSSFSFPSYLSRKFTIEWTTGKTFEMANYTAGRTVVHFTNLSKVMRDPIVKEYVLWQYSTFLDFVDKLVTSIKTYARSQNKSIVLTTNNYGVWRNGRHDPVSMLLDQFDVVGG